MRALSGSPLTVGSALAAGGVLLMLACGDSGTGNTTADMGTGGSDMTSSDGSPTLAGVSPRLVGTAGGDTLTLSGSNFQSGAQVTIGGTVVPASDVMVSSDGGSITVKAPARPGMAGKVDVTVKNPDNKNSVKSGALAYFLSNVGFQTGTAIGVDKGPRCVVAADLKKDGNVDLAVASADANTVSVFTGDGTGKFTASANRGVGVYPYAITVGDLDADGNLDVISANQGGTGSISVMRGDGKGGLDSAMASTNYLGNKPQAAVLADANNDGSLDLVVANFGNGNNSISVLTGNKSATFGMTGSGMQTINGGLASLYALVADDFNMDGKVDVVGVYRQASGMSNVVTLLNKGGGASPYFTDAASKSGGGDPLSVAVGDVNSDGNKDLAVFNNASSNVSILLGSASGKFSDPAGNATFSTGAGPEHGVLVDFDLDGTLDVMTASFTAGTLTFLHGNGDGTFASARTISGPSGIKPNWLAADDFNKDGQRDLALTDYQPAQSGGQFWILLGNGQ